MDIPSRDEGLIPFELWPIQRRWLDEVNRGLEDGCHEFLDLKGRQIGDTTKNDAFRLYWPQVMAGTQGMFVSNSDENRDYRRDVCLEMYHTLPVEYRLPVRVNNRNLLAWPHPNGSRLMFEAAGARDTSDLGRSRGLNFLDADEIGLWRSAKDVEALRASLSRRNAHRLYLWNGTAQGFNVLYDLFLLAQRSPNSLRLIFLAWFYHHLYRIEKTDPRWELYSGRLTADERLWVREVKRQFDHEITAEQLAWYRYCLDDICLGDETMRAQEFPCLPDDAFQSFGDKFIPPTVIRRLNLAAKRAPKATGYTWDPGPSFDETTAEKANPAKAPLVVWHEPEPGAAYIVAGHPWGSSSPSATQWVAQVFRAWPDRLQQCAEYTLDAGGTTQAFAWLLLYLAGAYRTLALPWIICEANGPGYAVMKHIQLMRQTGYGLSSAARAKGLQDVLGCFRHYFWARPDNLGWRTAPIDVKTNPDIRPYMLHMLADAVIGGQLDLYSHHVINSLAGLRRGESGDNDLIDAGGGGSSAHAMCAALVVRCWQDEAMVDLELSIPRRDASENKPDNMGSIVVGNFMDRLLRTGRTR